MSEPETKGLSREDLTPCAVCGQGLMSGGFINFYRVNVANVVIDPNAVQRTHGLEMMMGGSAALADVFSPDKHLAHEMPAKTVNVCSSCLLDGGPELAEIMEACSQ